MQSLVAEACQVVCAVIAEKMSQNLKRKRKNRRWWTRKWIIQRNHPNLIKDISKYPEDFKNLLRMSECHFQHLLELVSPQIQKSDTNMREALPATLKLQITLRCLATGDSFKSLEYLFRVPKSSISKFIEEVLDAVCDALKECIKVIKNIIYLNAVFLGVIIFCLQNNNLRNKLTVAEKIYFPK